MTEYNGEALALSAADNLWAALQALNLTDLDTSYRPSERLSVDSAGTAYRATKEALQRLLLVIVSVDPWITPHADVAESVLDALYDSGETPSYHLNRLRRDVLNTASAVEIDIVEDGKDLDGYAHVYIKGTLGSDGASKMLISATRKGRLFSTAGEDGIPVFAAGSWRALAIRIARGYRLSGEVKIDDETGGGKGARFTVDYARKSV